jgi:hypothetical protein
MTEMENGWVPEELVFEISSVGSNHLENDKIKYVSHIFK